MLQKLEIYGYRNSRGLMWNVFWNARRKVEYSVNPDCSAAFMTGVPDRIRLPASSRRFWLIY